MRFLYILAFLGALTTPSSGGIFFRLPGGQCFDPNTATEAKQVMKGKMKVVK
jgi:hypothetical protein